MKYVQLAVSRNYIMQYLGLRITSVLSINALSLARGPKLLSIKNYVIDVERRPFSASIMSRSYFASFPIFVYKFSSHYLNNIIFYTQ